MSAERVPNHDATKVPSRAMSSAGLTIVELLIAAVVLVTVLAMGGALLSQQSQLQRAVQARNDAQDQARVVLQLVTQDLSLAGSTVVVDTATGGIRSPRLGLCSDEGSIPVPGCLQVVADAGGLVSALSASYVSSQFAAADACRVVRYRVTGDGALQRSDVGCDGFDPNDVDTFATLAPITRAFRVSIVCSSGDVVASFDRETCTDVNASGERAYGRSAIVSFVGQSAINLRSSTATTHEFVRAAANDREVATVACGTGFFCAGQTQEVLLPNLKSIAEVRLVSP